MAYYNNYGSAIMHSTPAAPSLPHHTRSKRQPRMPNANHPSSSSSGTAPSTRQFRSTTATSATRSVAVSESSSSASVFRARFELMRGFDLEDDLEFCPALLTEDDYQSISSSSDRSSLSSNSPSSSPVQALAQPQATASHQLAPPFAIHANFQPSYNLSSNAQPFVAQSQKNGMAIRSRNAIPIVNPSTGMRVASPPRERSPMHNFRRW